MRRKKSRPKAVYICPNCFEISIMTNYTSAGWRCCGRKNTLRVDETTDKTIIEKAQKKIVLDLKKEMKYIENDYTEREKRARKRAKKYYNTLMRSAK